MTNDKLADEIERLIGPDSAGEFRRFFTLPEWQQIIAALRRQPSSDKVLVPRDVLIRIHNECKDVPMFQAAVWNLLAAAEAEQR